MAIKIQGTTILDDNRNLLSGNTITATSFVGPLAGNASSVTNGVYTTGNQTIAGSKTFTDAITAIGKDGTNGYMQLRRGNTTNPGYIEFFTPDDVRRSYIGWNNANRTSFVAENGWAWSFTGNVSFDSTTLHVDAINNRVGIGTIAPNATLDVVGSIAATGSIDTGTQFLGQAADTNTAPSFSWTGDTNTGMFRPVADTISFSTGGIERTRIDSSGRVGIGTTSPDTSLHIFAADQTPKIRIHSSVGSPSVYDANNAGLELVGGNMNATIKYAPSIKFGSTDSSFGYQSPKFGAAIVAEATESYVANTDGGMALSFWTTPINPGLEHGLEQRMTILSDGNVGVGITSPSERLHVEGTTRSLAFASANGTAAAPAHDFVDDPNTGMFLLAADTLGFATNGSPAAAFTQTGDLRLYNTAGDRYITISNQPTANVTVTIPVLTTNSNFVLSEGTATINGSKTFSDLRISGPLVNTGTESRDKLRVWSIAPYTIGMTRMNYGSLGFANGSVDYAMTFQMNNATSRGFWWGDDAHANSQGAMALSTNGKLVVATAIRVGFGESDIVVPSTTPALDVNGSVEYVYNDNGAGTLGQEGIRLISPDSASSQFLPQILAHNKNNGLQGGPYWNSRKTNGETGAATTGQALGTFNFQSTDTGGTVRNVAAFAAISAGAGASNHTGFFVFRTTSTGDSVPVDRMTLTSAGYLGVGTTAPTTTIHAVKSTSVGNTIDYPLIVDRITTGNPGIGMGSGIQLAVRTSPAAASIVAATIEAVATDITSGAEDFALVFKTGVSGSGANTTAEAMRINAGNRILLGGTVQYGSTGEIPKLQLSGSFNRETRIGFFHWQSSVNAGSLEFNKARSSTEGVYTAVNNNDNLGVLLFKGAEGNTFIKSASLGVVADGAPTTNYVPGRLVFETSDAGGLPGETTEKFRINNTGALGFGGANFGIQGDVLTSSGSGDVPSWGGAEYTQVMTDIKTLTSTTASQSIFPTATDTITLPVGTYEYEMVLHLSGMSATSGNALINILGAGTATISSALSQAVGVDTTTINTPGAAQYSAWTGTSSAASVLTAGTGTAMTVFINGVFRVSIAGTIIPSLSLVTAAAATVNVNTHMHVRRIYTAAGTGSFGPWS